jgi:glycine oxidase
MRSTSLLSKTVPRRRIGRTIYHRVVATASDVLVIGAGVIGCAVAYELARRGAAVRVFDARAIGAGATQASAGVLAPLVEVHEPGPLLDLSSRSLSTYDRFVEQVREDSGLEFEYRRCGTLEVAADDGGVERLRARVQREMEGRLEWIAREHLTAHEPWLSETCRGAVLAQDHGYVGAAGLTEALVWGAMKHGVQIETHRQITRVSSESQGVQVTAVDGSQWSAARVVIAAGSWAGFVGLDEAAARSVYPIRGQLLQLAWEGPALRRVVWGERCYVVPWQDGTVLVGATVEDVGFDERTTAAGVRDLLDAVCELLPHAWTARFVDARAGLRPATLDGLPIVGPSGDSPNVVYATGHFRNGVLLAPLTSALIGDLLIDNRSDPALAAISPSRFGTGGLSP